MTPEQKQALVEYVTRLQHALELDQWEIVIRDDPADVGDSVTASIMREANHASLRFSPGFFGDQQPDEWGIQDSANNRQSIVHELLHLHMQHYHTDMLALIERSATPGQLDNIDREYERVVDAIAHAIAPHYDLPHWPEKQQQESHTMDSEKTPQADEEPVADEPQSEPAADADESDGDSDGASAED